jgi:hypothetical protein
MTVTDRPWRYFVVSPGAPHRGSLCTAPLLDALHYT